MYKPFLTKLPPQWTQEPTWTTDFSHSFNSFLITVTVWITASPCDQANNRAIEDSLKQPLNLHRVTTSFICSTCTQTHLSPAVHRPYTKQEESTRCLTEILTKSLTCCGLQNQQGEEAADQDCTLHDGCQENSDSHTDYIYQGRKVKGHAKRGGAQRGASWWRGWDLCVRGVAGVTACHRDSTCTSSWLSFLERSQLGPRHQCIKTRLYVSVLNHSTSDWW